MTSAIDRIQGCLIDLDGTVYQEGRAIEGAASAIEALRRSHPGGLKEARDRPI